MFIQLGEKTLKSLFIFLPPIINSIKSIIRNNLTKKYPNFFTFVDFFGFTLCGFVYLFVKNQSKSINVEKVERKKSELLELTNTANLRTSSLNSFQEIEFLDWVA